jgi:hypothetical protein
MALKLEVEKLDDVPESARSLYKEVDGRFRLDVDVDDAVKTATSKANKEAAQFRHQVKKWEGLGKTPEEIQELLEMAAKAEEEKALKGGEWEKLKQQMMDQHNKALSAKDTSLQTMRGTLEKHLIDGAATAAIAEAKGVPQLLLPHVRAQVRVVEEDGNFVARVVNAKGEPRVDGKGEFMSIADLVGEMRQNEVFGRAFESSGAGGSGTPANGGSKSSSGIPKAFDFKAPLAEQVAFIRSKQAKGA